MLANGDVERSISYPTSNWSGSISKKIASQNLIIPGKINKNNWPGGVSKDGPQFEFKVSDVKDYEKLLRDYFTKIPSWK